MRIYLEKLIVKFGFICIAIAVYFTTVVTFTFRS